MEPIVVENKLKNIDLKFENQMVKFLENQCSELGNLLEKERVKTANCTLEIAELKNLIAKMNITINEQAAQLETEALNRVLQTEQLETLRENHNKINRELSKTLKDLQIETNNHTQLKKEHEAFLIEKKQEFTNFMQKQAIMQENIDELEEQLDHHKNQLNMAKQHGSEINMKKYEEVNELKLKSVNESQRKLEKIGRLLEENSTLTEKLSESEFMRKKLMEKNQNLEKLNKQLIDEKGESENNLSSMKKRVQSLNQMKSEANKIMDDKIQKLAKENELLRKEVVKLKKTPTTNNKNNKENEESKDITIDQNFNVEELLEPVEAKPFLFGPVDKFEKFK